MDKIYSEVDVTNSGLTWGDWKFAMAEDNINEAIFSFCSRIELDDPEDERWAQLFSVLKQSSNSNTSVKEMDMSGIIEQGAFDHSNVTKVDNIEEVELNIQKEEQDLSSVLVDVCNRLVPKLRVDLSTVHIESELVTSDLTKLKKDNLISVMKNAWSQIQSDESRLCFCIVFSSTTTMCQCLCKHILLSYLRGKHLSKLELLSSILCKEGETVCVNLIAPLLQTEDSPWVRDLPGLEELMSAMNGRHWNILLKELLSDINELQHWQIPILSVVVRKAEPSYQEVHHLVQLMSSTSTTFAQNRDFGALVAAVASSLKPDSASLGPQLKAIVENFKGSLKVMKLKTLKIIADITD